MKIGEAMKIGEEGSKKEGGRKEAEEEQLIKSNNPHLAGGETTLT